MPVISGMLPEKWHACLTRNSEENNRVFFTSSSNGSHANHTMYSEPIRSQENNWLFFTSNSNDIHVYQTKYSEPFRSLENSRGLFTNNSNSFNAHQTGFSFQALIIMAATPIRQGTIPFT